VEDHQRSALTAGLAPFVVAIAFLAGCGGGGQRSDSEAVRSAVGDFSKALGTGNGNTACGLLTTQARAEFVKRTASLAGTRECAAAIAKIHDAAGADVNAAFSAATVADVKVMDDTATATLTAAGHRAPVSLARQDGEWRLTGVPGI
jgi:hypothetical protein